jgi:hypothetical protein
MDWAGQMPIAHRRIPLRSAIIIGTLLAFISGCSETDLRKTGESEKGLSPGSVLGRVCDPSGRTWLPDALAYTHILDDSGLLYDTRTAYTDRDGYFLLDNLPADQDYVIYVQYGGETLSQEKVFIEDSQEVELDEPDCFDPLELDVAVITGDYDDFQEVLDNMGFANYELIDGLHSGEMTDFLLDLDSMLQYDIIFFNGGHVEEGIIYSTEDTEYSTEDTEGEGDESDDEDFLDDTGGSAGDDTGADDTGEGPVTLLYDHEQIIQNIRDYVTSGGAVYASDWAYDVIEIAWPEALNFVGADEIPNAAQLGEYGLINAAVSDEALAEWLGKDHIQIEYDLPVWPAIEGAAMTVSVHLTGAIDYREGTNVYTLTAVPLLVSFTSGDGKVAFATFRVAKNAKADVMLTLQYMMYSL